MKSIADFVPFVESQARTADTIEIQHAIRQALVQFMRNARPAIGVTYLKMECHQTDALIPVPECHKIVSLLGVYEAPERCVDKAIWTPEWREIDKSLWSMEDMDGGLRVLWFHQPQRKDSRVAVRYTWAIGRDAGCEIPDWLYEDYEPTITAGALALLHANPHMDQADPKFAERMRLVAAHGVATARARQIANMRGDVRPFGARHYFGG